MQSQPWDRDVCTWGLISSPCVHRKWPCSPGVRASLNYQPFQGLNWHIVSMGLSCIDLSNLQNQGRIFAISRSLAWWLFSLRVHSKEKEAAAFKYLVLLSFPLYSVHTGLIWYKRVKDFYLWWIPWQHRLWMIFLNPSSKISNLNFNVYPILVLEKVNTRQSTRKRIFPQEQLLSKMLGGQKLLEKLTKRSVGLAELLNC